MQGHTFAAGFHPSLPGAGTHPAASTLSCGFNQCAASVRLDHFGAAHVLGGGFHCSRDGPDCSNSSCIITLHSESATCCCMGELCNSIYGLTPAQDFDRIHVTVHARGDGARWFEHRRLRNRNEFWVPRSEVPRTISQFLLSLTGVRGGSNPSELSHSFHRSSRGSKLMCIT